MSISYSSKVTRHGQITLSPEARKVLGVDVGGFVIIEENENGDMVVSGADFVKVKK